MSLHALLSKAKQVQDKAIPRMDLQTLVSAPKITPEQRPNRGLFELLAAQPKSSLPTPKEVPTVPSPSPVKVPPGANLHKMFMQGRDAQAFETPVVSLAHKLGQPGSVPSAPSLRSILKSPVQETCQVSSGKKVKMGEPLINEGQPCGSRPKRDRAREYEDNATRLADDLAYQCEWFLYVCPEMVRTALMGGDVSQVPNPESQATILRNLLSEKGGASGQEVAKMRKALDHIREQAQKRGLPNGGYPVQAAFSASLVSDD